MRQRVLIVLVAALPFLLGAAMTAPYWVPELNVGGGYDAGGSSLDAAGNIWAAGRIYGEVQADIESLGTAGAAGTAAISQGDGTVAMEDVYQPGDAIDVGADGSVHVDALPSSVILETDVFEGASETEGCGPGLVPGASAGSLNRFFCVDGEFKTPSIENAVAGPGSSTDHAAPRWNGTDGTQIQDSGVLIDDSDNVTIPGTLKLGSEAHVVSNSQGMLDGGKVQNSTVTSAKMSLTGVTPGEYDWPTITVDAAGRIVSAEDGAITLADLADGPAGYGSAGSVAVTNPGENGWDWAEELSRSVLPVMVGDSGEGGQAGACPAPGAGDAAAGKFLSAGGGYAVPEGTGNVSGPGTSTDNAIARFDGTSGQTLQDSGVTIDDSDNLTVPGQITAGSGEKVLTNSAGLLDGGNMQDNSVPLSALAQSGATDGQVPVYDSVTGDWVPGDAQGGGGDSLWEEDAGGYIYPSNSDAIRIYDTPTSSYLMWLYDAYSGALSNSMITLPVTRTHTGTIGSGLDVIGIDVFTDAAGGQTGETGSYTGIRSKASASGADADIVGLYGVKGEVATASGSVVDNAYCLYGAASVSGTVGNLYGLKVADMTGGTNNYAIYTGSGSVRFGDNVHIQGNLTVSGSYPGGGGGGGPDTLVTLKPRDSAPLSSFASHDTRNYTPVLDFSDDTYQRVVWVDTLPLRYGGGGVTVEVLFAATTATSGNMEWKGAFEEISGEAQDLDSDGFATDQSSGVVTVSSTCGKVKTATITFTDGSQMDNVGAGDTFRFRLFREYDCSGNAEGDGEVVIVHIKETSE